MNVDFSQWTYNWVYVIGGLSVAIGIIGRHLIHKLIEEHIVQIKTLIEQMKNDISAELEPLDKRMSRIEYALYNDGKTGLINKVDDLLENQQTIKIDVEVMKARHEQSN